MRFNIITNLVNGVGLQQDYELLRRALEQRGHTVSGAQFNARAFYAPRADVNIFLEVVNPAAFPSAPVQWVVPNPEWWFAGWDQYAWDLILAKTHDCERIFTEKVGSRCQYLGWVARDLYDPTVVREKRFLHVSGKSHFKNTPAVIEGCRMAGVPLTVIGEHTGLLRRRVSEETLRILMNSHFCQVMPSAYEGYGQVLHESQAVGQLLITTNAPPMNEIEPALFVPTQEMRPHHAGMLHRVGPVDVAVAVSQVMDMLPEAVDHFAREARAQYHIDVAKFHKALDVLVGRV